eukprot:gene16092-21861_t
MESKKEPRCNKENSLLSQMQLNLQDEEKNWTLMIKENSGITQQGDLTQIHMQEDEWAATDKSSSEPLFEYNINSEWAMAIKSSEPFIEYNVKSAEGSARNVPTTFRVDNMNGRYRDFIDFLHGANIPIELPQIAVMGDTSSGKSSLLSAISGIQLPSNDSLTTRCPLRLRMEKKSTVSAQIKIQWVPNDLNKTQFDNEWSKTKDISNWDDIPDQIKRAQAHIIAMSNNKQIARDIIELSVYGPHYCDVTLVDLPGIVRSVAKDEDKQIITEIRDLIDSYLVNQRCVILAVVPANVDFHNSQIMADALQVDPSTMRTLPVITKPDLIDVGAEQEVKELLLGHRIVCELGFHMVKCRGQKDLNDNVSIEVGLDKEMRFFTTKPPWNDKDLLESNSLGVINLRNKLADIQINIIKSSLPAMISDILQAKEENEIILSKLTGIPTNESGRQLYANNLIYSFHQEVNNSVQLGHFSNLILEHKWDGFAYSGKIHQYFSKFKDAIMKSKLSNFSCPDTGERVVVILPDGVEVKGEFVQKCPDNFQNYLINFNNNINGVGNNATYVNKFSPVVLSSIHFEEAKRTADLPCFLNATLFINICSDYIKKDWVPLCDNLVKESCDLLHMLLNDIVKAIITKDFEGFQDAINAKCERVEKQFMEYLSIKVTELLSIQNFPYTQNDSLFEEISKRRNQETKLKLKQSMKNLSNKSTGAFSTTTAAMETLVDAIFSKNEAKSCDQHIAEELTFTLDAYGKVASKRIIDELPMLVREMLRLLQQKLQTELTFSDAELQDLLAEPKNVTIMRQKAMTTRDEMNSALEVMHKLKIFK